MPDLPRIQFNTTAPAALWVRANTFTLAQEFRVEYGPDLIRVPILRRLDAHGNERRLGFTTDLGSKPWWSQGIAGGIADAAYAAYIAHDWLYRSRRVLHNGFDRTIDREYADRFLFHGCRALGLSPLQADVIYAGVRAGGGIVWDRSAPMDLHAVTVEKPGPDWSVLCVRVEPSLEPLP